MNSETLRAALLARDFDQVPSLISEWGKSVADRIKSASGEAEKRRIYEEARAHAEQHLLLARVVRAHISADLQANSVSFLYADSPLELPKWRVSG